MPSPFLMKIIGRLDVYEDIVLKIERTDGAYGERTVTIAASSFSKLLVLGDGDATYDALKVLEDAVKASDASDVGWGTEELAGFSAGLNADNIVVLAMPATQTATITWEGSGLTAEELRDWMRYEGTTTNIGFPGQLAEHQHKFAAYLELEAEGGDIKVTPHVSVLEPNLGIAQVLDYGDTRELPLTFTAFGHDYEDEYTVFWYLKELVVGLLGPGGAVRIYFDVSVTTQRVEFSNPYGWEEWKAPGTIWEPQRLESDNITIHEQEIIFRPPLGG